MVEVSKSSGFTSTISADTVDGAVTSQLLSGLYNDTYFWRVRAIDAAGNTGDNSSVRGFLLDTTAGQVTASSPADGKATNAAVTVIWNAATGDSSGIDSYVVEVSKSSSFTSTISADTVDGAVVSQLLSGLYNDTYFWRVRAIDAAGNTGANSVARGFLLDTAAGQVTASSPADGSQQTSATVALTWAALTGDSSGIDSYVVEVSKSSAFTSTVFADTLDGAVTTDTFSAAGEDTYYWRVRAIDAAGNVGANSVVRGFVVDSGVGQVSLSSPANGNQTTTAVVALTWLAVSDSVGIDSYVVEISRTAGFTTTSTVDTVDGGLTTDTFTATENDSYYWRVRAIDHLGSVGANSAIRGFVVDTRTGQVTASSPADGAQKNSAVTVIWAALTDSVGIDSYVVEVSKSAAFTVTISADTVDGTVTSQLLSGLYNDTYFWRVRAIDNIGNVGVNSAARGFLLDTVAGQVTLSSPADGNQTNSAVTLIWAALASDSSGVDSYVVEVSKNSAFTSTISADTVDGAVTSQLLSGLYNDTYFWRVRAIDAAGNAGANSAARGFLFDTTAGQVALSSPADGTQTNAAVTAIWAALTGDSSGIDSYVVEVSKSAGFGAILSTDTVDGSVTSQLLGGLYNDTYFWRVRAIDAAGNAGANSASRGFLLDTAAGTVTVSSPADGSQQTSAIVALAWATLADSAGIDSYIVEVSKNPSFTSTVFADTVDGGVTTDTFTAATEDSHYWRVRAIDNAGNAGANSAVRGFLVDSGVGQVSLSSPADGSQKTTSAVALSWAALTDSAGIDSYVVEISRTSAFTSIVQTDTADGALTTDTFTAAENDTYFWRVRAIDNLGSAGSNSAVRGFVVDTKAAQVTASSPADGSQKSTASVALTWAATADSVGIDSYVVEVSKSAAFTSTVVVDTVDGSVTSDTPAGLYNDTYYWRVRAIDQVGNTGSNSTVRGFVVDTGAGQVVLSSPADGNQTTSASVSLNWAALSDSVGLDSYVVEVSRAIGFGSIVYTNTLDAASTSDVFASTDNDTYYWRVRATDHLGNVGANSAARGFVIDTRVGQVALSQPADAHETNAASVTLGWNAPADSVGIDSFAVELSKNTAFTAMFLTDTVDGTQTTRAADGVDNDTYFWRVRATDHLGNAGVYSAVRGFMHDTRVAKPTLTSPANSTTTNNSTPAFTWTAVTDSVGIDSYALEVSSSPSFASVAFTDTVDGAVTADTSTTLVSATYYWRVRAIDDLSNVSANSDSFMVVIDTGAASVTLVAPAAGHETKAASMTFQWTGTNADTYTWQLSKSSAFGTIVDSVTDTTATSVTRAIPENDTYFWRVIGRNTLTWDTSPARGILLDTAAGQAVPSSPADGYQTATAAVALAWAAVSDSVGIDSYVVEASKTAGFSTIVFVDTTDGTNTTDTVTGLYNDTYFWRVRAIDHLGNAGANSAVRGFLVDSGAAQAVLSSPADGTQTATASVALSWLAVSDSAGIDSYAVEVSNTAAFAVVVFVDTTDGANTTDTVTGLYNDTYFWRVRAIDHLGNAGANSGARGFLVDSGAAQAVLSSPADGYQTATPSVALSWLAVSDSAGVDSYAVEVSNTAAFAAVVFVDTTDGTNTTDTVTGLYNDTYFWRVRAIDPLGNAGANSAARGFVVDTAVPQVTATAPADLMETSATTVVMTWAAVADSVGVDSYVVEASNASGFTSLVFADTVDGALTSNTRSSLAINPYYWRVRAVDNLGNVGPNSVTRLFTINSPWNGPKWYVNDGWAAGDSFTYEGGADTNGGDGSPQKPFRTIAKALSRVNTGDTVYIDAGLYAETVVIDSSNISLIGAGSDTTVIDPPGANTTSGLYGIYATGRTRLLIEGLGVTGAYHGIFFNAVSLSAVSNDSVSSCGGEGIYLSNSDTNTISACVSSFNINGIFLNGSAFNALVNNTVQSNSQHGMYLASSAEDTLTGNLIQSNNWMGVYLNASSRILLQSNRIQSNGQSGVYLLSNNSNILRHNAIRSNAQAGVVLDASDINVIAQNDITGNDTGVKINGTTSANLIGKNNIHANAVSNVTYSGAVVQSLSRNWWGSTDESAIGAKFAVAFSDFRPYRLAPVDTSAGADTTAPAAPTGVALDTSEAGYITVSWTNPSSNEETNGGTLGFAGVKIYRLTNTPDTTHWGNALVWTAGASDATWRDNTVTGQNTYYYRLTSRDGASFVNESFFTPDTKFATRIPPPPSPADTITIVSGNHQLGNPDSALSLRVRVVDTGGAGSSGARVIFKITYGVGAHLGDTGTATTTTAFADASGYVSETLVLGSAAGVYRVEARNDSATPNRAVAFTAYVDGRDISDSSWRMVAANKALITNDPAGLVNPDLGAGTLIFEWREDLGVNAGLNGVTTKFHRPLSMERGRGYWMKPATPGSQRWVIDEGTQGVAGFDTVRVSLNATGNGWNQIGSGQYFYIDWQKSVKIDTGMAGDTWVGTLDTMLSIDSAHAAGVISKILYWYDGSQYQWGPNTLTSQSGAIVTGTSTVSAVQMKPMVGFWVKALQSCTMYIFPNPAEIGAADTGNLNQAPKYGLSAKDNAWAIQIIASGDGKTDAQNYVGVMPDARAAALAAVYEPPAAAGGYVAVAVRESRGSNPKSQEGDWLAASFAEPDPKGRTWDVMVASDVDGPVTLSWDNVANLPPNYEAYLIGDPAGPVSLRQSSSLVLESKIQNPKSKIPLTLAVGLPEYVSALLSSPLAPDQTFVYPNPGPDGAGNMMFKYNLGAAGDVTIKIFDVGGRLVRELKQAGQPGSNTATWDTTNKHGQKMASGVYIYILESQGARLVDKLAIVR